jgi:polyphosphate glucokinase
MSDTSPVVLAIDVGGSHVKVMSSAGGDERKAVSGPKMDAAEMTDVVDKLAAGLSYDVVSIGYPGPVVHNRILSEPHNLAPGWVGFDFAKRFGKPSRIVNDALMQAIGSYAGGRMLFLGLGTGLGAAMVVDNVAQPMELAHLPYRKGRTYEDYLGEASLEAHGQTKWQRHVVDAVAQLSAALEPDYVVIGGGNATKLESLPANARLGDNTDAFKGGFAVWLNSQLQV